MDHQSHAISWFEIPVLDMERAKAFYEAIFAVSLKTMHINESDLAIFPHAPGMVGGALVKEKILEPCKNGAVLYLNADPDLQVVLNRLEKAGGELLTPKMPIGDGMGFIAYFRDTEGNSIGLHSDN
jgi:predicted enzyme related to lactoylglutathione lyase